MSVYSPPAAAHAHASHNHLSNGVNANLGPSIPAYSPESVLDQQQRALQAAIHAFDQAPAPSLREVLGAYRLKGDGDREMLLAILNAKAAEDQRIASMASLHQTILQAVHASAVSLALPPLATANGYPGENSAPEADNRPSSASSSIRHSEASSSPNSGTTHYSNGSSRAPGAVMSISSITSPSLHPSHTTPPLPCRSHMEIDGDAIPGAPPSSFNTRMQTSSIRSVSSSASGSRAPSRSPSQKLRPVHRHSPIGSSGSEARHSFERISSERSTS